MGLMEQLRHRLSDVINFVGSFQLLASDLLAIVAVLHNTSVFIIQGAYLEELGFEPPRLHAVQ